MTVMRKGILAACAAFFIYTLACPAVLYAEEYKNKAQGLAAKIAEQKLVCEQKEKEFVKNCVLEAKALYKQGEYKAALNGFLSAQKLAPDDEKIAGFINKCEKSINETSEKHYLKGLKLYKKGNLVEAADEFVMVEESGEKYKEAREYLIKIEEQLKQTETTERKSSLKSEKEEIEKELKDLKEELSVAQLRKQAQEQKLMLEVEKAYVPSAKTESTEEIEAETAEEKKEKEEAGSRAKVIAQMDSITVPALSLNDADIRDVIRQLMNMTGVTIVLDESALSRVAGDGMVRITFTTITPMPLLDLLDLSLKTTGLSYRVESAYIWISDKETLAKEELITKTYRLKYGVRKAREVSLTEFNKQEGGGEEY